MATTILTRSDGEVSRLVHPAEVPELGTIVIDPPWLERGGGKIKRGADRHYPLMPVWQIIETIIRCPLWRPARATGVHVGLWVTNNRLADRSVYAVADALGVRPVTLRTWVKDKIGIGRYARGQTEHILFCVAGPATIAPPTEDPVSTLIEAPRREHSEKPDSSFDDFIRTSPGPRAEIFARTPRPGWYSWGNDPALAAACAPRPT